MNNMWLNVGLWRMIKDRAVAGYAKARDEAEQVLPPGARWPVLLPDGTKVGMVSRSAPGKNVAVTDPEALLAWAKEHYPGEVEPVLDIVGTEEQVKAALYEHEDSRHLVRLGERLKPSLRATVVEASAAYGAPAGPGGELDVPGVSVTASAPGRVSFLPADGAYDVIVEMVRTGKVDVPDLLDDPAAVKADPK